MPALKPSPPERELQKLIALFLRAETDIINEIGRLRSQGLVDYHAAAALERVQNILRNLESDSWEYVPRMIEAQFYVNHPEVRKPLDEPETPEKHLRAYQNARVLTSEQTDIVQRLTQSLMGQITEASAVTLAGLEGTLIGRTEPDVFRRVGLEQTTLREAMGRGTYKSLPDFVAALRREGVTAFVDRAGRRWSLHSYGAMVSRTTSRQAQVLSVLTADPERDLYKISAHGTTCPLCAPYEGRVYSRSGRDPDFPPLAAAFGKMDPSGPDGLSNTWLNIHPNCLHAIVPWTAAGHTPEEIQKIKDFSDPRKNPFSRDPRTEAQREAYRKKEVARRHWLEDYRQWEKYRAALGDQVPKTFAAFRKHKLAGDEKYRSWKLDYRRANALESSGKRGILKDISGGAIPVTGESIRRVPLIQPEGWSLEQAKRLQEAHRELLRAVQGKPALTEAGRVYRPDMSPLSEIIIGEPGASGIKLPSYGAPYISIHSHPGGEMFSEADIESFIFSLNMSMMTAVGNNGSVYAAIKTLDFDGFGARQKLLSLKPALEDCKRDKDVLGYLSIISKFLEEGGKTHGFEFIQRRT